MKNKDAEKLEAGQKVIHRRYGVCIVKEVIISRGVLFGVVIRPDNQNGRDLLRIEKALAEPGEKPIDHEMVWGIPEGRGF